MSKLYRIPDDPGDTFICWNKVPPVAQWEQIRSMLVPVEPDYQAAAKALKHLFGEIGIELSNTGTLDIHKAIADRVVDAAYEN